MRECWFDDDDEPEVRRMTNEEVIDSFFFLLNEFGEIGSYSSKTHKWAEEVLNSLYMRGLIYEIEEE